MFHIGVKFICTTRHVFWDADGNRDMVWVASAPTSTLHWGKREISMVDTIFLPMPKLNADVTIEIVALEDEAAYYGINVGVGILSILIVLQLRYILQVRKQDILPILIFLRFKKMVNVYRYRFQRQEIKYDDNCMFLRFYKACDTHTVNLSDE